jgi:phosphoenolpyruvate phosphomutase
LPPLRLTTTSTGLKQNSLFGTERKQQLDDIPAFQAKIAAGKKASRSADFMVIARLEALIAGWGEEEAIKRATAYIEAGADAIMIHSKEKSPDEVLSFLAEYRRLHEAGKVRKVPVVAVPTTYNTITEDELADAGVSICIYANHMLRAAYPSMVSVAESILTNGRSKEADDVLLPVKEIITLIDDNTGMK